jgi:beta-galactosidase
MTELIKELITNAGIRIKELPENVEYHERYTDTHRYAFYINEGDVAAELLNVTELLSGQVVNGKISVDAKNVMIIKGKI